MRTLCHLLIGCVVVAALGGCSSNRLKEERNALYLQNQELQERLNQARAALDACENDRGSSANQLAALQAELAALRMQPAPAPVARGPVANTSGFATIEGVETIESATRITVRIPGDILFAPGRAELKAERLRTLDQIASVIQRDYGANIIRVEGYTDTDPIKKSKWADNLELSLERAAAVHRHLQKKGITGKRLEAVGLGEWHPAGTKEKSRRVDIVVVLNR